MRHTRESRCYTQELGNVRFRTLGYDCVTEQEI